MSKNIKRGLEITDKYFLFLENHINDMVEGRISAFMELNQIAGALFVSHSHLSDTIHQTTGHHPCYFYDFKIIEKAKSLLIETDLPIAQIAKKLTYDPSNFSKFFKKLTGHTPGEFRMKSKNNVHL